MRPGMPAVLGQIGRCLVLGLPGNPVSVLATLIAYGVPLLDGLQGRSEPRLLWHAALASPWENATSAWSSCAGGWSAAKTGV